jgi:hypothetical protein
MHTKFKLTYQMGNYDLVEEFWLLNCDPPPLFHSSARSVHMDAGNYSHVVNFASYRRLGQVGWECRVQKATSGVMPTVHGTASCGLDMVTPRIAT